MTYATSDDVVKTEFVCSHCGENCNYGNKFCKECLRATTRHEMCAENKKLMPDWKCKMCGVE